MSESTPKISRTTSCSTFVQIRLDHNRVYTRQLMYQTRGEDLGEKEKSRLPLLSRHRKVRDRHDGIEVFALMRVPPNTAITGPLIRLTKSGDSMHLADRFVSPRYINQETMRREDVTGRLKLREHQLSQCLSVLLSLSIAYRV
jgi:hypothetical protein